MMGTVSLESPRKDQLTITSFAYNSGEFVNTERNRSVRLRHDLAS